MNSRRILIAILALTLASLACSAITGLIGGDSSPPTAVIEIPPGEPPAGGEAPAGDGQPPAEIEPPAGESGGPPATLNLDPSNAYGEPAMVSFYRTSLEFQSHLVREDGSESMGRIVGNAGRIVDPHAMHLEFNAEGTADIGGERFVLVQLGGTDYFVAPTGECVTFPSDQQNNPYTVLLSGGGMLGTLNGAQLAGLPEVVNGVNALHYTFDETNLDPSDPGATDVSELAGHLWIAWPGGYVVRILMDGRGSSEVLNGTAEESDLHYELNYYDFDVPVDVAAPPECVSAGETDHPVLDDASNTSSFPGMFSYTTQYDFETVVEFYRTEMPLLGCTPGQEMVGAPTATLAFTNCPNGEVMVTVSQAPGGGFQVGIIAEQG